MFITSNYPPNLNESEKVWCAAKTAEQRNERLRKQRERDHARCAAQTASERQGISQQKSTMNAKNGSWNPWGERLQQKSTQPWFTGRTTDNIYIYIYIKSEKVIYIYIYMMIIIYHEKSQLNTPVWGLLTLAQLRFKLRVLILAIKTLTAKSLNLVLKVTLR